MISAAVAATVTLILLFILFNPHVEDGRGQLSSLQKVTGKARGNERGFESFQVTDRNKEIKPTVNTTKDKRIYAGIHIKNIYNLSIKDRSFMAEGWYWLKWPETINNMMKENNVSQDKIVEFINQVDTSSTLVEVDQPNPQRLTNGY